MAGIGDYTKQLKGNRGFKMKSPSITHGTKAHRSAVSNLHKTPVGPRAIQKPESDNVPLSPGYEDPIKIQKVQREGITPHSQKFSKIAAKNTKKKSPVEQTDTTYADRTKKSKREQDFGERYTAEKAKDKYWYKINNKAATKAQYMAYKNKPGGDEPGKQTNDPNVSLAKQSANKRK
tara:strand:+ start:423 stop:953 length:531 start_codon:yes stop_codon:yes gene_type:complete